MRKNAIVISIFVYNFGDCDIVYKCCFQLDGCRGLRAGNDQWLHPSEVFPIGDKTSGAATYYMQKPLTHILFAEANSSRINNQRYLDGNSITVRSMISHWK